MRYPEFLKAGGTIGFIAPSFGCTTEPYRTAFLNSQRTFRKMGYSLDLGPNCYEASGIGISNTPELCAAEINSWYASDRNDILISCGGGELMCEDLDYVDWQKLQGADPKWFMGYSDNTNLSFLLTTLCDTASIYGPNGPAFGMEPWHPALNAAMDILTGRSWKVRGYDLYETESLKDEEHPLAPYHVTEPCVRRKFPDTDGCIEGRLIGGCLDCLVNLLGTRYDHVSEFNSRYSEEGVIWFLEACELTVLGIRRALWQMKNAGWFQNVRSFLIGRPYNHGQVIMGLDQYRAVTDILGSYGVPIWMDLDIGHIPPAMPLVLGSYAKASMTGNEICIEMQAR